MKASEFIHGGLYIIHDASDVVVRYDITSNSFKSEWHEYPLALFLGNVCATDGDRHIFVKPIPLTAEILEKNGFDKKIDSKIAFTMDTYVYVGDCHIWLQFINDSIFLGLTKHGAGSFDLHKYVKSVHELQHALRLCGLTALADSFKIG